MNESEEWGGSSLFGEKVGLFPSPLHLLQEVHPLVNNFLLPEVEQPLLPGHRLHQFGGVLFLRLVLAWLHNLQLT